MGNAAVYACLDGCAEGIQPGLIFFIVVLQSSQTGTKDFTRICILAALDFLVYELIISAVRLILRVGILEFLRLELIRVCQ